MEAATISRPRRAQSSDSGTVKRRMTWNDVTPFPGNPIYKGRLASMRKEWGGYYHGIVGSPAIYDNSAMAFPDFPPETLFVGDGNHRHQLALQDGKVSEEFLADLYRGMTRAEMFKVRRGLNDRRTVKPAETFLALVEEGDLKKRTLKDAVEGLGWAITHDRASGGLPCVNELEWIWARDKAAMLRAIQTYERAFGVEPDKSQARVIKGLGQFWVKYPDADSDRLVKSLKGVKVDALYLSGKTQKEAVSFVKTVFGGIAYVLAMGYNKNLDLKSKARLTV